MARIRFCPNCGHQNTTTCVECEHCGADLSGVKAMSEELYQKKLQEVQNDAASATDHETSSDHAGVDTSARGQQPHSDSQPAADQPGADMKGPKPVKICPECGTHNGITALFCSKCHFNIKKVRRTVADTAGPTSQVNRNSDYPNDRASTVNSCANNHISACESCENEEHIATLVDPSSNPIYQVTTQTPVIILGREHTLAAFLESRTYTSREHAQLIILGSRLALKDLGKANGSYINNKRLNPYETSPLTDGDKISLGGKWDDNWQQSKTGCFIVRYPNKFS